jgi:S1-C subfamily serine protease
VVNIEARGGLANQPDTKRGQACKGTGLAARNAIEVFGSGMVFDARRGLILTNNHVIDRADDSTVRLTDGRVLPAQRVDADPVTDVAVIRVHADGLTELPLGDSDLFEVGDFVFAIGNPAPIGQTVSAGIISGLHRANVGIGSREDFIQTDAAIYPGNSGGALVNLRGDLVGITTAFVAVGSQNPGMGFAIPINLARVLTDQMLEIADIGRGARGLADAFTSAAPSRGAAPEPCPLMWRLDAVLPQRREPIAERLGLLGEQPAGEALRHCDMGGLAERNRRREPGAPMRQGLVGPGEP